MKSFDPREELNLLREQYPPFGKKMTPLKEAKYNKLKERISDYDKMCKRIDGSWFPLYNREVLEDAVPYILDTKRTRKWINQEVLECFVNEDMRTFLIHNCETGYDYVPIWEGDKWKVLFPTSLCSPYFIARMSIAGRGIGAALREYINQETRRAVQEELNRLSIPIPEQYIDVEEEYVEETNNALREELELEEKTIKKRIPTITRENIEFLDKLNRSMMPDVMSGSIKEAYSEYEKDGDY